MLITLPTLHPTTVGDCVLSDLLHILDPFKKKLSNPCIKVFISTLSSNKVQNICPFGKLNNLQKVDLKFCLIISMIPEKIFSENIFREANQGLTFSKKTSLWNSVTGIILLRIQKIYSSLWEVVQGLNFLNIGSIYTKFGTQVVFCLGKQEVYASILEVNQEPTYSKKVN